MSSDPEIDLDRARPPQPNGITTRLHLPMVPGEHATLAEWAQWYAEQNLAVFPLKGKVPMTEHGFKDATTDAYAVQGWWKQWPNANIGIATGSINRLLVVDVDRKHGGLKSARELFPGGAPPTARVATGGGGAHFYFRLAKGQIVQSKNALFPGIDLKAEGGYVVAPPSIHPETKKPYAWVEQLDKRLPNAGHPLEWMDYADAE